MEKKSEFEFFIERLQALMQENGFNNSTLSIKTNIPRGTISNWFNNKSKNPSLENLSILAKIFKYSVDYFIGLEDEYGNKTY